MVVWVARRGELGCARRATPSTHVVQSPRTGLFPYGTVVVNITGTFASGFLTGLFLYHGLAPDARVIIGTGFLRRVHDLLVVLVRDPRVVYRRRPSSRARRRVRRRRGVGLLRGAAGLGLAGLF